MQLYRQFINFYNIKIVFIWNRPALTNFISKEILPLVETCPKGTFQCGIGGCLDLKVKCNGKEECLDGSDENLPECPITGCK